MRRALKTSRVKPGVTRLRVTRLRVMKPGVTRPGVTKVREAGTTPALS